MAPHRRRIGRVLLFLAVVDFHAWIAAFANPARPTDKLNQTMIKLSHIAPTAVLWQSGICRRRMYCGYTLGGLCALACLVS